MVRACRMQSSECSCAGFLPLEMKCACPSLYNAVAPRASWDTVNEEKEDVDIRHDALNECQQDTVHARLQGVDVVTFGNELRSTVS